MEEENTDRGRDSERTESGKQSRTTESGKRVCRRKKQLWKSGQAASKDMEERSGKRLKAQKAFCKKLMRDLKKFNRKKKQ